MGILEKLARLKRYAAFATGDFERIFEGLEIPACPEVVTTLLKALDDPDIQIGEIVRILESDAALSARIISVANSALFSLSTEITSISKAVTFIGLKEIANIALGYALTKASRDPGRDNFHMDAYWTDTLVRALFAKAATGRLVLPDGQEAREHEAEEAFAGALFQDIALPVIMGQWFDLYGKVFDAWVHDGGPMKEHEDSILNWTHAQAGAWIAGKWELPDILVCAVGLHEVPVHEMAGLELPVRGLMAVRLSSLLPSALLAAAAGSDEAALNQETLLRLERESAFCGLERDSLAGLVRHAYEMTGELASALGVASRGTEIFHRTAALLTEEAGAIDPPKRS